MQRRGRSLLNLRLLDAEGGLLGRTLLTLVSNKGFQAGGGKGAQQDLPPHKFSPHDVVAVRPNKGGAADGPPLTTGAWRVVWCGVVGLWVLVVWTGLCLPGFPLTLLRPSVRRAGGLGG